MKSVWREYGVIGTLLIVAIGGYLVMSRSDMDVLNSSLQTIGNHLLALVPDNDGRADVEAALDTLRLRVARGEVDPDKVEQYAASVFNIGTTGATLAPEEAEMVVRLAYSDQDVLPRTDAPTPPTPPTPPKPTTPVTRGELDALASNLKPMVAFFETVRPDIPGDSTGPSFRFYSDGKLHVVADDRVRPEVEKAAEAQILIRDRSMSWRAHFSEAAEAERQRFVKRAEEMVRIAQATPDSLHVKHTAAALARLNRLRSLGLVSRIWIDSVMIDVEAELESVLRDLPPPPVEKATGEVSVSSSGSTSG